MSGEAGYYFTNLCCATTFIENITGESLNMSEQHFQSYVTGEAQPPGYYQQSTFLCEALRIMCSNNVMIADLKERQSKSEQNIEQLSGSVNQFLNEMRANTAQYLKPIAVKSYNVADDVNISLIPTALRQTIIKQREKSFTECVKSDEKSNEPLLVDLGDIVDDNSDAIKAVNEVSNDDLALPFDDNAQYNSQQNSSPDENRLPPPLSPQVIQNN